MSAREPVLTRQNAILADSLANGWGEVPMGRVGRLHALAMRTWLHGNRETFDRLRPLLAELRDRREELTPEEDAELRRAYRLEVKA